MVYRVVFKRVFDFVISVILLLLFGPIILLFGLFVKLESKGPMFFIQIRVGRSGKEFTLYKLRSMKQNENRKEVQVFHGNPDITSLGKFIRRFKIDELPQIWNVLIGDMSLVGPRPCLPTLLEKFDENAYCRLKVRPGLTGWAQVNGNIFNSWPKRWELDRYYVENISSFFDLKIIAMTIGVVLFGEKKK